jgi:hypothetical protein
MTPDQRSHSSNQKLELNKDKNTSKSDKKQNPLHKYPSRPRYIISCNSCELQDESHFYDEMEKIKENHVCEGDPKIFRLARSNL